VTDNDIPTGEEIAAMTPGQYKTFENRCRRAAQRQGLELVKSRRRDPLALDYGTYRLYGPRSKTPVAEFADLIETAEYLWGVE
jgi:hypothetical protein